MRRRTFLLLFCFIMDSHFSSSNKLDVSDSHGSLVVMYFLKTKQYESASLLSVTEVSFTLTHSNPLCNGLMYLYNEK
jgi:hypothetical protein